MKWSILGLLMLGFGAAVSASILVASMKMTPGPAQTSKAPQEVQIVLASKALPAMSIVDGRSIEVKSVPINDAPKDALKQPTDVVGKLLAMPVVEGQYFSTGLFADNKSGARLAAALGNGMRAVSISLKPDKAGMLFPGCMVDVLVSLNRPSEEGSGIKEAMSITLLQGIFVLAIDDMSVMSEEALAEPSQPETTTTPVRHDRRERMVTLRVDSNQAMALQLATQFGAVSLALRNSLDLAPVAAESTMLSDLADPYTRMVALLSAQNLGPGAKSGNGKVAAAPASAAAEPAGAAPSSGTNGDVPTLREAREARMAAREEQVDDLNAEVPVAPKKQEKPKLEFMVNRSGNIELVRFRRDQFFEGLKDSIGIGWVWDGRAMSSSNSMD